VTPRAELPGPCQPLPLEASNLQELTAPGQKPVLLGAGSVCFNRQEKAGLAQRQRLILLLL